MGLKNNPSPRPRTVREAYGTGYVLFIYHWPHAINTPEECWIFEQRVSHLQCASDHQSHGAKLKRKIVINGKLQRPAQLTKARGAIERMARLGRSCGSHRLERRAQTGGGRGFRLTGSAVGGSRRAAGVKHLPAQTWVAGRRSNRGGEAMGWSGGAAR